MKRQKTGGKFYGWYIVLAGMVIFSAIMGIIGNCISLFLVPVCRDLGFSRKAMGANQTIIFGCTALFSFFAGKFFETFNSKRVLQVCGILAGVAYFSYSFATKLWQFYLLSTLCGFCFAAMTIVPMSMIINNWFHQKSGVALGISFMGSGVGGMVFNFIAGGCMEAFGWRAAYRILAGLMLLLVLTALRISGHLCHPEKSVCFHTVKKPRNSCSCYADRTDAQRSAMPAVFLDSLHLLYRFWLYEQLGCNHHRTASKRYWRTGCVLYRRDCLQHGNVGSRKICGWKNA